MIAADVGAIKEDQHMIGVAHTDTYKHYWHKITYVSLNIGSRSRVLST
jgi:hypothetical protein